MICRNARCHFLKVMALVQCRVDAVFLFSSKRISCSDLKVLVSCQVGNWSLGPHTSGYLVIISSCRLGLYLKSLLLQWKHLIMGL